MHENDVPQQLKIKLMTQSKKKSSFDFLKLTTFVNRMTPFIVIVWKENKNLQKRGKYAKITKIGFMTTGCSKKKDHLRKKNLYVE